jgi:hypothetical protein
VDISDFFQELRRSIKPIQVPITGESSAAEYATLTPDKVVSIYCSRLEPTMELVSSIIDETSRFPNVKLLETTEPVVYFDCREQGGIPWASPIQTWIELARRDTRQQ